MSTTLADLKARRILNAQCDATGSLIDWHALTDDAIALIEQTEEERDDAIDANRATAAILKAILDEPRGWANLKGQPQGGIARDIHDELKVAWKRLTGTDYVR